MEAVNRVIFGSLVLFSVITHVESLPSNWQILPKDALTGVKVRQLDAGIAKSIWALDFAGKPLVKVGLKGQWSRVNDSQNSELSWVSSGAAGVWAIEAYLGVPVYRDGISEQIPGGVKWLPVEGRGFSIIESGLPSCVYALTTKFELYYRDGISASTPIGSSWKQIWGKYKFLSAGSYGVWVIDLDDVLHFGRGSSADLSLVTNWKEIDRPQGAGPIRYVVAGFDGSVWALSDDNVVFMRDSVNILNPTGKNNGWRRIEGLALGSISAGLPGVIGVTLEQSIVVHKDRKCGGLLQETGGTFSTPNYPNFYPHNVVCLWVVRVPKAKDIIVTIEEFDIGDNTGDFLTYSEDGSYRSEQKFVRNNSPGRQQLTFQGETAIFEFVSDGKINARGFLASYISDLRQEKPATTQTTATTTSFSGCGGFLKEASGSITSPDYPNVYKSNTDCTWVITVPIGQRIKFIVEQMDIENESSCKYDYLRIGDGSVKGTRTRDTICGTRFYDLVSEGNEIWVQFFSDSQIERRGFKASWLIHMISTSEKIMTTAATVPITQITTSPQSSVTTAISGCGGTILQNSGSITSPDYPNIYKSNTDCTWVITVPIGQRIKFIVEQMDIENESSCKYDYLRIGDGSVKGTRTRDTICGTRFYDLVSEGNEIWVQFFSDSQIERRGFKASWLIHMVSTTEKIMTTTATKQLPEGWRLLSAPVLKRFTQIDSGMTDLLIAIDSSGQPYIRANDAWSNILSENLKYVTTGDSGTWGIDSRNHVRYRSSSDRRRWDYTGSEVFRNIDSGPKGFLLGVRSNGVLAYRDGMSTAVPYGLQWVNLGGTFKSVSVGSYGIWGVDNLGDVHFARRPSDLKVFPLSWRLINGPYLTKIDAGFGNNVWGVGSSGQVLKRDGVSHDTPFGTKWISFNDVNVNDITVGFNGIFGLHDGKIIKKDNDQSSICGGILTAESGRILSPGYPLLSYSNTHCLWIIRVPSAQRIRLSVSFFNVFKTPNCLDDYILLYKRGFYSPEYGVEKYCGNEQDIFPSITYNTNEVWLQFNAASRQRVGSYGGFDIRYYASASQTTPGPSTRVSTTLSLAPSTASIQSTISKAYSGCGGDLSSNFGALTSPGFPQQYQNNLRCIWKISLHPTRELTLKFDQFSVEDDSRCQYDFLLIKTSENGRELGRFCGTRSQPDIIVGGNTAWIYFKTDDSLVKRGFRIIWTSNLKRGVTAPQTQPTTMETKGTTVKQTVPRPTLAPQIPTGWNRVPLNIDIAHVDGGISPNAWAVDVNDNTYVQDGRNWRLAGLSQMIWVTSGGSGVWGISRTGQLFYRLGVAPLAPKGIDWEYVVSPSVYRVDSGPMGSLLALDYTGRLYLREGITASNSKGTRWNPVGSGYKHLSVGSYGYWAVSDRNEVFFATMAKTIQFSESLRWTRVGGKFSQIKAGFGSSLWGVTPEGDLYYRAGISAITPRGLRWVKESNVKVNGVTTGMSGVFASVQGTNQLITKPDRICGDIFTATAGSFGTPGYPLNYPSNTTCLWQIKVPGASKIIVEFDDFQLEEIQSSPASCNRDYLLYLRDGQFPSEFGARKRCGRSSAPIIFEGDKAWIEFVSNDAYNSRGFLARYRAIEEPGRITKATETTAGTTPVTKQPTTFGPEIYKGCGGSIDASTVSSGRFAHPSYPVDYSPSQTCTYVIRTVRGKKISLDFDLFDLEGTSDCRYDSFEIRDGESASDPLIGLYCDKLNLKDIKSTGNALYLRFRSDSSTQFKGYLGRWRSYMDIPSTTKKPDTTTRSGFEGPSIGQIQRSCGGEIDATSQLTGYFAHTNYPNQYSNDANCTFVIKAPPGRKIKIRFEKFALEDHETCRFDRIEVRNIEGSQPIQKFCGKVKPSAITSKGNSMTVQFVSDFATTDEGFLIRWNLEIDNTLPTFKPLTTTAKNDGSPITACGGTFRSDSGLFATPNYPNNYGDNLDCQWNFIVSENKVIELTFEVFKLEQSPSTCNYDFVQIFDVVSNRDIDLGKYCDTMPNEIRSSGEQLKVLFRSDSGSSERGFVARWIAKDVRRSTTPLMSTTKQPCFQNLAGVVGQISEGGESSFYQPYRDCTWLITVGRSNIIKLELPFFSIEDSPFCNKDSLKIYDGPSEVSHTIANLCGEHSNRVFYSSGNQVRIVLKTDGANNARGFNLLWSSQQPLTTRKPTTTTKLTIPATTAATLKPTTMVKRDVTINICDTTTERVSGESGTITSPDYPSYYPPNQRCSKIIETSPNKRLTISFKDFALEPSIGCQNDRLFIDDGDSTSSYCGYNKPADLETTKNSLTVMFESDISTQGLGFRLTWKSETVENMDILPEAPSCGGKLFGSSGMLESPKFSRLYPFTTTCTWVLEVGPSSSIDLQLLAASFYKEDCNSSLLIRDGLSYNSKPINVFCRNATSSSFKSNGNTIYIEHKIEPNAKSQFVLKWFERTDNSFKAFNCGGIKTKSSGSIASPGFPLPYPNDLLCTWMIVAPKGHKISMEFTNFKLEQETDCSKDYLLIRDGSSSVNTAIGRYCGTVIPRKMLSSRNSIWLQLRADCKVPSTGFRMTWKFVRDGAEGTVEPGTLRLSTQMQTTQVPTRVQTTRMQTTRISTRLLTTREMTSETTSTQPETTPTVPNVNARGGLITGQNGVIQSPSYPRPYPNNADITWVLMGPSAGTISITFRAFSLEEDSACRYDYVELRDGPASNSPFIGKFCGRNVPATFMSADNALFVKFKSDVSENQAGFRANWQWVPAGVSPSESKIDRRQTSSACGGVLTRESGEISSPNYPGFYPPNSDCIWVIKPPSGKPVEISFKSFNIEAESRCGYDFVELRDGESRQSRTLGKFCGSSLPNVKTSGKGTLWIRFKSDSSTSDSGFLASWKTINIKRRRREIKTENFNYPECNFALSGNNGKLKMDRDESLVVKGPGTTCSWTIKTSIERRITLHVRDLGFRKQSSCVTNHMEIYRVFDNRYELLKLLCPSGEHLQRITIPTRSRRVFVKYITDGKEIRRNFKVKWTTTEKKL